VSEIEVFEIFFTHFLPSPSAWASGHESARCFLTDAIQLEEAKASQSDGVKGLVR
jgi:hypothetical protein